MVTLHHYPYSKNAAGSRIPDYKRSFVTKRGPVLISVLDSLRPSRQFLASFAVKDLQPQRARRIREARKELDRRTRTTTSCSLSRSRTLSTPRRRRRFRTSFRRPPAKTSWFSNAFHSKFLGCTQRTQESSLSLRSPADYYLLSTLPAAVEAGEINVFRFLFVCSIIDADGACTERWPLPITPSARFRRT